MSDYEMFNKFGVFQAPDADQLGEMDTATRERFESIRLAALASESADADVKAADQAVRNNVAALTDAESDLRRLCPPRTHTSIVKEWILCQQLQRG